MEIGIMQAGVKTIQSLDLDLEAINSTNNNKYYFSHNILHTCINGYKGFEC